MTKVIAVIVCLLLGGCAYKSADRGTCIVDPTAPIFGVLSGDLRVVTCTKPGVSDRAE